MEHVVILQARVGSTRLPGKSMKPVAGYPSAVLAALRAGNAGSRVIVATSTDAADDLLAAELMARGLEVVRGPLQDVLARFELAGARLGDSCAIVRLTGDNLVPDGKFVQELAGAFENSAGDYFAPAYPQSGLPYGLGGEVFSAAALRRAHKNATSRFDREHVGPWMARNCRASFAMPSLLEGADLSQLRCTIDDQEDYARVCRLFEDVPDPRSVGWRELVKKLAELPAEARFRIPYKVQDGRVYGEMALGTVQLGVPYGIANRTGMPDSATATAIVRTAIAHGVTSLDCARGYGQAEAALRAALAGAWRSRAEVITKLDPMAALSEQAGAAEVRAAVEASVNQSCSALGTNSLPKLLLHRWRHRHARNDAAWERLLEFRQNGVIGVLGASLSEPREVLEALDDPDIAHLQIPFNLLDHRWRSEHLRMALAQRPEVVVHARSAFLQGLLISEASLWPQAMNYNASRCVTMIQELVRRFGRRNAADLCLAYVRAQDWITSVVVGCETVSQVQENLQYFCLPKLTAEECEEIDKKLPEAPEALLNPAMWNHQHESSTA
jgi:aryl-alcohol dehydrogenase-like predicted oxidoreductase/spore coat polysaccharide biosynthesis protein SpsF (cytidylyltransferase family)